MHTTAPRPNPLFSPAVIPGRAVHSQTIYTTRLVRTMGHSQQIPGRICTGGAQLPHPPAPVLGPIARNRQLLLWKVRPGIRQLAAPLLGSSCLLARRETPTCPSTASRTTRPGRRLGAGTGGRISAAGLVHESTRPSTRCGRGLARSSAVAEPRTQRTSYLGEHCSLCSSPRGPAVGTVDLGPITTAPGHMRRVETAGPGAHPEANFNR